MQQKQLHHIGPLVTSLGESWQRKAANALHSAFPEFAGRSLSDMILSFAQQSSANQIFMHSQELLHVVEMFCGHGVITRCARLSGLTATKFDRKISTSHDILRGHGFRAYVQALLLLESGGVTWISPDCKSWVWISRSISRRTAQRTSGDTRRVFVCEANDVLVRTLVFASRYWPRLIL